MEISIDKSFNGFSTITIENINFYGQFDKSPNEEYIVAWNDGYIDATGEKEQRVNAIYLLIKDDELILSEKGKRPQNCAVANDGTFVVNEEEKFYAFSDKGKVLVEYSIGAIFHNNAISPDGTYAVCQTIGGGDDKENYKLFFFDLKNEELKWKVTTEPGLPSKYEWDTKKEHLKLIYDENNMFRYADKNTFAYRYNFQGDFIDEKKYKNDILDYGSVFQAKDILEESEVELKKKEELNDLERKLENYREIIDNYKKQLKKDPHEKEKAKIHRKIGEIYERFDKKEKTIEYFEKAVEHDPKVGVKRKLSKLKS